MTKKKSLRGWGVKTYLLKKWEGGNVDGRLLARNSPECLPIGRVFAPNYDIFWKTKILENPKYSRLRQEKYLYTQTKMVNTALERFHFFTLISWNTSNFTDRNNFSKEQRKIWWNNDKFVNRRILPSVKYISGTQQSPSLSYRIHRYLFYLILNYYL